MSATVCMGMGMRWHAIGTVQPCEAFVYVKLAGGSLSLVRWFLACKNLESASLRFLASS